MWRASQRLARAALPLDYCTPVSVSPGGGSSLCLLLLHRSLGRRGMAAGGWRLAAGRGGEGALLLLLLLLPSCCGCAAGKATTKPPRCTTTAAAAAARAVADGLRPVASDAGSPSPPPFQRPGRAVRHQAHTTATAAPSRRRLCNSTC